MSLALELVQVMDLGQMFSVPTGDVPHKPPEKVKERLIAALRDIYGDTTDVADRLEAETGFYGSKQEHDVILLCRGVVASIGVRWMITQANMEYGRFLVEQDPYEIPTFPLALIELPIHIDDPSHPTLFALVPEWNVFSIGTISNL